MSQTKGTHAAAPRGVLNFLESILPFSELDAESLRSVAECSLIELFPKGSLIFKQNVTEVSHLHVIQTGGVKAYLTETEHQVTLKEFGGRGATFGADFILKGLHAECNVEAVEDTFCLLIPKEIFMDLHRSSPRFADFYKATLSEDLIVAAYSEQRLNKIRARSEEAFYLFTSRVIDLVKDPPEFVSGDASVQSVAALMADRGLKCALVTDATGTVIGTVANLDLRSKVVAKGLDYGTPVERIMSPRVSTLPALALSFEAVVTMMEHETDQLVVVNKNQIVGVIDAADMMVHLGSSPLFLFREIGLQRSVEGLHDLSRKVPLLVRSLIEAGAMAGNIAQMIAVFADNILNRILELIEAELGPPPLPYDWLGLASEGRKEHTFRAEQSNGLLYEDSDDPDIMQQADRYFRVLSARAVESLEQSGYPRCKNEFVAADSRWCKPWSAWRQYFDDWIMAPTPPDIYLALAFFDFRSVAGNGTPAESLRAHVEKMTRKYPLFLKFFARYFLLNEPPLSFYENAIIEKDGNQTELLDLKTRGVTPFVDFARILALLHGLGETNTPDRLRRLREEGFLPEDLYEDVSRAFDYDVHLLLVHQLRFVEEGVTPENFVAPAELSDLERKTLQFSFAVIEKMMDFIRKELNVTSRTVPPVAAKPRQTVMR